jgi:hypothetical protein
MKFVELHEFDFSCNLIRDTKFLLIHTDCPLVTTPVLPGLINCTGSMFKLAFGVRALSATCHSFSFF